MTELEGVEAASISMRPAPGDVTRARFDDGAARQAPASSATVEIWRLRGLVKPGRLEQFRSWADAQGAGWFDFLVGPQPGAGDYYMQGRFVGGAGRVSYQQTAARAGATRWMAEMEIERRPLNSTKGNLIFWPHYAEIKSDLVVAARFSARLADDADGQAPRAELVIDNVGAVLTQWVESSDGGNGAVVKLMQAVDGGVQWSVELDVVGMRVSAQSVTARLGFDPMLHRPAVQIRHDPEHSPGLF